MKIEFHPRTSEDLLWFHQYYQERFPEGQQNAQERFERALTLLGDQPKAGHPSDFLEGLRDLSIDKTPFIFIYEIDEEKKVLTILMVYDTRQRKPRLHRGLSLLKPKRRGQGA